MNIAILGWGSLIWNNDGLTIVGRWQNGGPILPIEFSRISMNGRLTLVIDERNGADVTTLYARSGCDNLNDAIENLIERECISISNKYKIGFFNMTNNTECEWSRSHHPTACDRIKAWAQEHNCEAVIWTALSSNFEEKRGEPFSTVAALRYVNGLAIEVKHRALEYIQNAPHEVDTPFRRLVTAPNP